MRRRILAVGAASAVLLIGLVGCSSTESSGASDPCAAPIGSGMLSNGVQLDNMTDGIPSVTITGGTSIVNPQVTVLREGERSKAVAPGDVVTAEMTVFDAATGDIVLPTQARFLQAMPEDVLAEFTDFLTAGDTDSLNYTNLVMASVICSAPGDVLAVAATPGQALTSGYTEDAIVIIVNVLDTGAMQAQGRAQTLPWGFPALASDETGRPGVVFPPQAAPTQERVATAIEGTGSEVLSESYVIGNVLTIGWNGTERANSWESGVLEIGSDAESTYGFRSALNGIAIGSRVVILDPNNGDPQVHVVDILAAR